MQIRTTHTPGSPDTDLNVGSIRITTEAGVFRITQGFEGELIITKVEGQAQGINIAPLASNQILIS